MNPTTATPLLVRLVKSLAIVVVDVPARPTKPSRRKSARTTVLAFAFVLLASNFGLSFSMDSLFAQLRDPEYGRRLSHWKARAAENPGRPMVLCLGSSRTAMGLRPDIPNAVADRPLLFNGAIVGSGPVMQVMALRRWLHDGIRPDAVVLEYWPAFMREDGPYLEELRIDKHRLLKQDIPFIRDYFGAHESTEVTMRQIRRKPWYEHRLRIVSQIVPGWLTYDRRLDGGWHKLDGWGWLPGYDEDPPEAERTLRLKLSTGYYEPLFRDFCISPIADRATRELIETCQSRGIPVSLLWLPESTEFRSWYTPAAKRIGDEYLAKIRAEYGVPLIDARDWVPDPQIADGFHMTQNGAAIFSEKIGPAIAATYPDFTRGRP